VINSAAIAAANHSRRNSYAAVQANMQHRARIFSPPLPPQSQVNDELAPAPVTPPGAGAPFPTATELACDRTYRIHLTDLDEGKVLVQVGREDEKTEVVGWYVTPLAAFGLAYRHIRDRGGFQP
jgi:hypothetical protein